MATIINGSEQTEYLGFYVELSFLQFIYLGKQFVLKKAHQDRYFFA